MCLNILNFLIICAFKLSLTTSPDWLQTCYPLSYPPKCWGIPPCSVDFEFDPCKWSIYIRPKLSKKLSKTTKLSKNLKIQTGKMKLSMY